jgi:hypothetical protein
MSTAVLAIFASSAWLVTRVLIEGCARRKLDPVPFLLGPARRSRAAVQPLAESQGVVVTGVVLVSFLFATGVPREGVVSSSWCCSQACSS